MFGIPFTPSYKLTTYTVVFPVTSTVYVSVKEYKKHVSWIQNVKKNYIYIYSHLVFFVKIKTYLTGPHA